MYRTISTSGYSNITVIVKMRLATTTETGEYLQCVWYNGSTWAVLKQINKSDPDADGQWHTYNLSAPSGANNNPSFALKFSVYADNVNYDEDGWVDDLTVQGTQ